LFSVPWCAFTEIISIIRKVQRYLSFAVFGNVLTIIARRDVAEL